MLGQRRVFGVRIDSHKNINNALVEKQNDAKSQLAKSQLAKSQLVKPQPAKRPFESKKPELKLVTNIKRKAYGGRQCMVSESMAEQIDQYLKDVEKMRQLDSDFLKDEKIDGRMRGILLDWVLQIQAKFQLTPETFYLACFILDRVIKPLAVTRKNFQLIGLGCVFTAAKFEEVSVPNVNDFVYMGGNFCSVNNLFEAERDILKALNFQLTFTYPNHFLRKIRLVTLAEENADVYEVSKILIDVCITEYSFAHWLPSQATAASVHLAHEMLNRQCPEGMSEIVGIATSATVEKSKLLKACIPAHVNQDGKLRGLRLKYKDMVSLKLVDNYISSLNALI